MGPRNPRAQPAVPHFHNFPMQPREVETTSNEQSNIHRILRPRHLQRRRLHREMRRFHVRRPVDQIRRRHRQSLLGHGSIFPLGHRNERRHIQLGLW